MFKHFIKNFFQQFVYLFIRLVYSTYRLKFSGLDNLKKAKINYPQTGAIFVLWHEHLISGIHGLRNFQPMAVVSSSKDGDLIAHTMEKIGFGIARGSSTRGGAHALLKAVKGLRNKRAIVLTVDGPKGPRNTSKPGALSLSKKANAPIIPITPITNKPFIFKNSWDQCKLPLPFSKIIVRFGSIIQVPSETKTEEMLGHQKGLDHFLIENEKKAINDLKAWKKLESASGAIR